MKSMKSREVRGMTEKQILDALEDKREALFNLRFQKASGQLEDLSAPGRTQREIARLLTILREKQTGHKEGDNG